MRWRKMKVNPRSAGGLIHIRHGGGGVGWGWGSNWPHVLTQKLREIKRRRKKRSIALNDYFRKYFSHLFAQVNIEVTRGHQR